MTGEEVQAAYFGWFHIILYLIIIFAVMIGVYQFLWMRKCNGFVKVLVVKPDGGTDTAYAPKSGGYVTLKAPGSNTERLWPINKLSAIEMLYPGDGFIPVFLQKKIKTVIVDEEDWEPLLNRGSYSHRVASPDVVQYLREMAEEAQDEQPEIAESLETFINSLSTAPTREMVASPAVLGNIMKEKFTEMAVTISKETFDRLEGISRKLDRLPNALILYAGLGIIAILVVVMLMQSGGLGGDTTDATLNDIQNQIQSIKNALGVP